MPPVKDSQYRIGMLLVAGSAVAWSLSGMFVRLISTDLMTTLAVRGLISGSAILTLFFVIEGRRGWDVLLSLRWPALLAAVLSTASMITGIGSFYYAAIADSMVIYATGPFVTAFMAWLLIGERPPWATLMASTVALGGVMLMLSDMAPGSSSPFGILLAVLMTITAAGLTITMRHWRNVPMLPAMAGSAWLCSLATAPFASVGTVGLHDLGLIAAFAIFQNAMGLTLYTFGSRRIPAAEASLLISLEVPLTPLIVWLVLNEVPSRGTLVGGAVVLAALFAHILWEMRRSRPSPAQS